MLKTLFSRRLLTGMCAMQQALYETVRKRDPAQSEFLQAVEEACAPHLSKAMPSMPAEATIRARALCDSASCAA